MGYYDIAPGRHQLESELLSAIFRAALDRGTGTTGMFGLRLQGHSLTFFLQKLRVLHSDCASDFERMQKAFGRTLLIHLTRQNKLDQAISCVKATQTGLWHKAPDGVEIERRKPHTDPVYDATAIKQQLSVLTELDAHWNAWFAGEKLTPYRINYDDLAANPIEVLNRLLEHLGLDRDLSSGIELPVAKLADVTSKIWADRFLADSNAV